MPEVSKSRAIHDHFKANPKAKAQDVVDALAKQGIMTTVNYVMNLKSAHNKSQAAKKAAGKQAKTNGVNKTQVVRDYLKTNKKAKNAEVVAALAKQGITITANYVGNIKATHNKRRQAVRQVVAKAGIGIPEVKAALAFIKAAGSVAAAKQAFAVAEEIRKIV